MRDYELLMLIKSDLSDEARKEIVNRVVGWIKADVEGAPEPAINEWGDRKLAYQIDKQSSAFYVLIECQMEPSNLSELERNMRFVEDILRHLITRNEELAKHQFDYKDVKSFSNHVSEHGHINPRRRNRMSAKQQRSLAKSVKRARHVALLPFVVE